MKGSLGTYSQFIIYSDFLTSVILFRVYKNETLEKRRYTIIHQQFTHKRGDKNRHPGLSSALLCSLPTGRGSGGAGGAGLWERLPYQVQTAAMFPPTDNKKKKRGLKKEEETSRCPNLTRQTHKHH